MSGRPLFDSHNRSGDLPGRVFLVRKRTAWRTKHVSLTVVGSQVWKNQVLFRDYLLRHPTAAVQYRTLKRRLARRFALDRGRYTSAKSVFVRRIVLLAQNLSR